MPQNINSSAKFNIKEHIPFILQTIYKKKNECTAFAVNVLQLTVFVEQSFNLH